MREKMRGLLVIPPSGVVKASTNSARREVCDWGPGDPNRVDVTAPEMAQWNWCTDVPLPGHRPGGGIERINIV